MTDYKLVPVEPTAEMVSAAEDAYMPFGDMELALRMAILAAPAVQGEPVAYAVFTDNGNIRIWSADPSQAEALRLAYGDQVRPLYASPQPAIPEGWKPIDTAPKDNKRPLMIARFNDDEELMEFDYDASWESDSESWEIPEVYYFWASAKGDVEEPTHWMYQPDWFTAVPQPAEQQPVVTQLVEALARTTSAMPEGWPHPTQLGALVRNVRRNCPPEIFSVLERLLAAAPRPAEQQPVVTQLVVAAESALAAHHEQGGEE